MSRFGKRIAVLTSLSVDYPVGRDGARFEAQLPTSALLAHDTRQLRYFVIQDDLGNRYPAMIEETAPVAEQLETTRIRGVVVAGW